jgi:hypothetical protein
LDEAIPRPKLFRTFAAAYVERFDLIATTRKNAKPMLFPTSFSQQLPTNFFIN